MTSVLVHPQGAATAVAKVLDLLGASWKTVDDTTEAAGSEPSGGWAGAIVAVDDDPERAFELARWVRSREQATTSILMLVSAELLPELGDHTTLFDDFCLTPFHPAELEARLDHLLIRSDGDDAIITYGPLSLNVETYQAMIDRRPLDLTYMEYELLRYLTASPGKVFSREILLSEVWGYDYYGGARTVDVHIRRLRSKLGEEHANLISTVRSVGYRLGQAKWT
ncbi:MAG: response regulator transcription factor [Acidimicrobiales bacterium]|nr:MAG: response regulator transcription factor [Acidimicrobiales bacterium]